VRRSVNKAKKEGIVAKKKWDKDIYWSLTLNTYSKQGTVQPFSQKLLFSLIDIIQQKQWGEMWIAETTSMEIAAAEIIIWDHQMAYRWSAASNDHYNNTGATSFLLFEMMTYLQEKGFKKFNMMAANTPHLAKFISSFNPQLVPYYSVNKSRGVLRILNVMRSIIW
jgi:lipid II:glycine glycyltransferase (peptidoglycan interpeptide bridge formation enzyme)